jgi:hypothetical protein
VKRLGFILFIFALFLLNVSCSKISSSKYDEYLSLRYEVPECTQTYTYATATTLSGTAVFYKRGLNLVTQSGQLKNMTLGDPVVEPLPIRYAEVGVYNSTDQIVQCGVTDALGELKALDGVSDLQIPKTAGSFTVRVFSRMSRTLGFPGKPDFEVNLAVKKDKYTNEVYFISSVVNTNGVNDASVSLTAYARQTDSLSIEGGAFNILNSIYTAYDYIRSNTGTVDTTCLNPKFSAYWRAGFNPAQYVYPSQDPATVGTATFYDKSSGSLFISGGKLGNINLEMTSHFDDFVIIHEFGHHVEDVCGSLLTPGGNHYIISRVDARLAWAEGWANYFAAQVMYDRIDTLNPEFRTKMAAAGFTNTAWTYLFASEGFSDSVQNIGNGSGFMFDLKKPGSNPDTWQTGSLYGQPFDKVDPERYPGEGHFREGAITRGLFKLTNTCGGACITAAPISFENIWKSMDKITGIGQSIYKFKSSSTFLELLKSRIPAWVGTYKPFHEGSASSNTAEALQLYSDGKFTAGGPINKWVPYGVYATPSVGPCASRYFIEPRPDDPVLTSTNSDERYSNHYYTIDPSALNGADQISVTFSKQNASGTTTEFDLLLFEEDFFFGGDYSCASYNSSNVCTSYQATRTTNDDVVLSDRRSGSIATKTITGLQSLDQTKRYLLNIKAYTANKSISTVTDYEYLITTDNSGEYLCPQ